MTLDEWHQVLATEPATPRQLGAVLHQFERLGYQDNRWDRPARLAAAAALLHLGQLDSTRQLTMGQAGQLLHALQGFRSRAQLETRLRRPDPLPLATRQALAVLLAMQRSSPGGAS
jgi:hypothetical protein